MNNLHRELAPISDAAWAQIEEETTRTLKRYIAGRRVVDVHASGGTGLSAVGTGHLQKIAPPKEGIVARQRAVKALVELRVPFELERQAIDDVDRGANDSDWQPAKDAARKIAFAEDGAVFEGYTAAGIVGIRKGTSNPTLTFPADVREYPASMARTQCCWGPMPTHSNHTDTAVQLYLQETFTFLLLTPEAGVALVPPTKAKKS